MQYRDLGKTGIKASVVGIGTWAMGGWRWGGTDEKDAIRGIQASIDQGITLIDTAPAYGLGLSEEIVGKAVQGQRHKVVIATKCGLIWHDNKGTYFFDEFGQKVYKYLGPESIRLEVENSLNRLKTDYIDLYQTHWQDPTTPIEDTMEVLLDLQKEGKIRAIGVSNVKVEHLEEYVKYGMIASAQEKYSMFDRGIEQEILPWCDTHSVAVLAYSPLAQGLLTGKIGPEREFTGDDQRLNNPRFSLENRQRVKELTDKFIPIAQKYQISLGQLAIAWTAAMPGLTHVLCGVRNDSQAIENAGAGNMILDQADIDKINSYLSEFSFV